MQKVSQTTLKFGWVVVAMMASGTLSAQNASTGSSLTQGAGAAALKSSNPGAFIQAAAQGNIAMIDMAKVAEHRARNSKVKQLAQMIQRDHTRANQKLQKIAAKDGVAMTSKLPDPLQDQLKQLKHAKGAQFDRLYVKDMLRDHQKEIAKFQRDAQQLQQIRLRDYALSCVPVMRKHLRHAEQAAPSVGISRTELSSILNRSSTAMGGAGPSYGSQSGVMPNHGSSKTKWHTK